MSFWKKKDNLIIALCVGLFFIGLTYWYDLCCVRAAFPGPGASPTMALQVPFIDQNQAQYTLEQFKGKPLIVHFWATWCPVCTRKLPSLNAFAAKFEAKGGKVISISEDSGLAPVKAYYARNPYDNLDIYLDNAGQLMGTFGASGLPTAIFIDEQGKELGRIAGGIDWDSPQVADMIKGYYNIDLAKK